MAKPSEQRAIGLPEIHFLLIIGSGGIMKTVSLDEYSDTSEVKQMYLEACRTHGNNNVRYCKVVGVKVVTDIQFIEDQNVRRPDAKDSPDSRGGA